MESFFASDSPTRLLEYHERRRDRIVDNHVSMPSTAPLDQLRIYLAEVAAVIEDRGYARFTGPQREAWRYTLLGALFRTAMYYAQFFRWLLSPTSYFLPRKADSHEGSDKS